MIQPLELASALPHGPGSCRGCDVWDTFCAAARGDVVALRALLARDPNLCRAEYWYTQPIHFAVREGHVAAVQVLLEAGAEASFVGLSGEDLVTIARDRGHLAVARVLERACSLMGPSAASATSDGAGEALAEAGIHTAAAAGDVAGVRSCLDSEPGRIEWRDAAGATPLHRAVASSARAVVALLLDRGARVDAVHGRGAANAPAGFQAIDLALWTGPFWGLRGDTAMAALLIARGAAHDLAIASALGDRARVERLLDEDPERISSMRPCGKRALSSAVEFGHPALVRLLLERGADPCWPEGANAPRGLALHAAARVGDRPLVELLLAHGADPQSTLDSSGSATFAARTPDVRALLLEHGGSLDPYDLIWLEEDDEALRRVRADPRSAHAGCGGVLAAACAMGKQTLLVRLLEAGVRVPPVLTPCRSYLLEEPAMLRLLLASGMDPDLPNWQRATPLHELCARDGRGRPRPQRIACAKLLLDAGATLSARDEEYRSTPLAWAARNGLSDMVELLLARGAPTRLEDDAPWATPLAWATRRDQDLIVERLRQAGARA